MATIRIDSEMIEEYFADECHVEVTSFSWGKYNNKPDCEYEIVTEGDLEYEDDDYVDKEEYDQLKTEYEESQDELVTVQAELALLKFDLETANNKLVLAELELSKIVPIKTPWYKF